MPVRPCPRCKQPLEIPQPPPAKVQCPKCAAVLRLGATAPAGTKSNPEMVMSRHDLAGAPLPPQADNPFALSDDADPNAVLPLRHRRRSSRGPILALLFLLLIGGGVVAFFVLKKEKKEPDIAPPPDPGNFTAYDQKPLFDPNAGRVNEAIRKGVDYLKKQLLTPEKLYHRSELADVAPANAHLGASALAGLTLLECGTSADDPSVQRAAQNLRDAEAQIHATYTLATAILFLDRLHQNIPSTDGFRPTEKDKLTAAMKDRDRELIRSFALRLMTCQDQGGFWGYGRKVSKAEEDRTFQTAKAGKFAGERLEYKNLSNSQFASLALWAARRHGVPVRPALEAVANAARLQQTKEGAWHYDLNLPMKHSSVCAGLIFLALERGLAEEGTTRSGGKAADPKLNKSVLEDPAVKKGMDYLGKFLAKPPSISAEKKKTRLQTAQEVKKYYEEYEKTKGEKVPPVSWTMEFAFSGTIFGADSWGDLYLLWSIERVGVIYDLKTIHPGKGGKDWYAWGSEIILNNQKEGGLWEDRFPGVPDTCFALLFLKRANIAKDLTDKLREAIGWGASPTPPGQPPQPAKKE